MEIAILGAGDLGGALAHRLAQAGWPAGVTLVDADAGRARGKALDILQECPVLGSDTQLQGSDRLAAERAPDVIFLTEPGASSSSLPTTALVIQAALGFAPSLRALVAGGHARERALGSAPFACANSLRVALAAELDAAPRAIALTVLGVPPAATVVPAAGVTLGGLPVDRLFPLARRRALQFLVEHPPGPVALAAAAVGLLRALSLGRSSVLPVAVALQGEYGHRGPVVATPARLGGGRLQQVLEAPLDPVDRVAFDLAAERHGA